MTSGPASAVKLRDARYSVLPVEIMPHALWRASYHDRVSTRRRPPFSAFRVWRVGQPARYFGATRRIGQAPDWTAAA
jgi:hypothetical protein